MKDEWKALLATALLIAILIFLAIRGFQAERAKENQTEQQTVETQTEETVSFDNIEETI